MKDPRDKRKSSVRWTTPPPSRPFTPRKHYTKEIKRPTNRDLVTQTEEEFNETCTKLIKEVSSEVIVESPLLSNTEEECMPYITKDARKVLDPEIDKLCRDLHDNDWPVGEITYIFYRILLRMFKLRRGYQSICEAKGILGCVADDLWTKHFEPYEREKEKLNGDVE